MAAKITFEWYCTTNKANSKEEDFTASIDFITNSEGEEYDNGTKK